MDSSVLDTEMSNEFDVNNEWDACLDAVEKWDKEQELIAQSNAVQDDDAPRAEYLEVLHRCFGHKNFRPMQWKIINSIINDRRDNCSIMATGYGKSLCFQYPSVYIGGLTIVVSPLISLMEDQVLSLTMSNINACLLGTAQTNKSKVTKEIFENKYSLVYLTPEFCCGDYGQDLLTRMHQTLTIILIAIDEAHCVSSWGHDFRYQYRDLWKLRNILPDVPILATTATATPKVRNDIISCLKLRNPQVLCSGFDRPNLQFAVYLKGPSGIFPDLKKIMADKNKSWGFPGSTIIYCITRKQTEEMAQLLKSKGVQCLAYHAGMTVQARKNAHEQFVKDKMKVIVATIAFGMGIDKPDVRNIIHYGASKDIESYYQEVGRAGRDGQPSICVTFYRNSDFDLHRSIQEMGGISNQNRARREAMEKIMLQYLETRDCRRQFILNHFEGSVSPKKPQLRCCDNCTRKLNETVPDSNKYEGLDERGLYDFTQDALVFLNAVQAMGGRFGIGTYILLLRGSKSSKLFENYQKHALHGSGKNQSEEWWKCIGRLLERESYLKKTTNKKSGKALFYTFSISAKGQTFMNTANKNDGKTKILLQPTPEMFKMLKRKRNEPLEEEQLFIAKPLPSTSKRSTSSKPSLKLLQVPSKRESKCEIKASDEVVVESNETETEKDERMKVYRLLMNKRTDLASSLDCMPYMIASNETLMKMAQLKPLTLKELRECQLDGFTEAKISRFGEEFMKIIRSSCQLDPIVKEESNSQRSIQDILAEHPIPGASMGARAEASYSMYKSGLTVQEIADKRGVVPATVLSHLIDAIKAGYPVKMIDLNVTDEMRDIIIDAIGSPAVKFDLSRLTPIKNACPPEVTFDNIKVVVAFLQVRQHLAKLKISYEEFESPLEINMTTQQNPTPPTTTSTTQPERTVDLDCLFSKISPPPKKPSLSIWKCEKRDAESDSDSFIFDYCSAGSNPPKKKKMNDSCALDKINVREDKDDLAFLDSPPRSSKVSSQKSQADTDLEKSLLEDDYFDNIALDDVDKAIEEKADKSVSSEAEHDNSLSSLSTSNFSLNGEHKPEKVKVKKFNFKSIVPPSVERCTKSLCSPSNQRLN